MEVAGFDYTTGKGVSMTPAQWRAAYRPAVYVRKVANGETWFLRKEAGPGEHRGRLVAEAYGIIPAGKTSPRETAP